MLKTLVILFVAAVVVYVARQVWVAVLQLRVGAVPEGVDVVEVPMVADRGWQVTRSVSGATVTICVEHPVEGTARTWTINLREPGAAKDLERTMQTAGMIVSDLTGT